MGRDDSDWKAEAKAVPELRFLKTLVTGLALVMGLGMIAVVALLWLRLAAFVLTHQLNSRMDDVAWPLPAVSGSFNSACMVAQATSA